MTNEIKIETLNYPENVRRRTGMYLGDTNDFTTPLREIINNSQDEMLNGYADKIVIVNNNKYKLIADNGRGLPCYENPNKPDESILIEVITSLHSGSKFNNEEVTSGLNGVGSSVVNAVSERYIVIVKLFTKSKLESFPKRYKDEIKLNSWYFVEFRRGKLYSESIINNRESFDKLIKGGSFSKSFDNYIDSKIDDWSTIVIIEPDLTIYESGESKVDLLPLSVVNSVNDENSILLNNETIDKFNFLKSFEIEKKNLLIEETLEYDFTYDSRLKISGEFGFSVDSVNYSNISLINLINTSLGGFIEQNICNGFGEALSKYNSLVKKADIKLGLLLYNITFTSYEMSFNSQTKEKLISLGNKKIEGEELNKQEFLSSITKYFTSLIKKNKDYFDALCERIIQYKSSLNKLSTVDYLRSKVILGNDSRKRYSSKDMVDIYEATSEKWEERELYIPEGRSASGNLIKYRNKATQSILPIRGKLINTTTFDESDLVDNQEILTIINAIGCGVGQISDYTKSKYGKIIIAGDSDQDASHIANLITALFLIHIPDIIKQGMLYRLISPFYKVSKGGKVNYYYLSERDKIDFDNSKVVKRKGLGSYTPEEAKKFMMDVNNRRLIQIKYPENEEDSVKEAIKLLYSSNARRKLMEDNGVL